MSVTLRDLKWLNLNLAGFLYSLFSICFSVSINIPVDILGGEAWLFSNVLM